MGQLKRLGSPWAQVHGLTFSFLPPITVEWETSANKHWRQRWLIKLSNRQKNWLLASLTKMEKKKQPNIAERSHDNVGKVFSLIPAKYHLFIRICKSNRSTAFSGKAAHKGPTIFQTWHIWLATLHIHDDEQYYGPRSHTVQQGSWSICRIQWSISRVLYFCMVDAWCYVWY